MAKLKEIEAKFVEIESKLGSHIFLNVPVLVEEEVDPEKFDASKDDYLLPSWVIEETARILAKKWLKEYLKTDVDGNHLRRYQLSADEVHGIMLVCGIRAVDLASIVQLSPPQVSKVLNGADNQTLSSLAVRFLLYVLKGELYEKGFARRVLEHKELCVRQTEEDFNLKRA